VLINQFFKKTNIETKNKKILTKIKNNFLMEIILNNLLFITLGLLLILSASMVALSSNPVHSILFLVLVFIITTILFLLANVEFISMLFLVVYLGAIIVLFLFVVMMLNIRIIELKDRLFSYLPISMIIIALCFVPILSIIVADFINPEGILLEVNY
jgi:NADH-quinone oxidoreductase subunit J